MTLDFWWRLHLLGWPIWVPATVAFAGFIVWARARPKWRPLIPWGFLLVLLASVLAYDFASKWQIVFLSDRKTWAAGVLALSVTSALPLAVCVAGASTVERHLSAFSARLAALAVPALIVRLILGAYLSHWIQRGLLG